MSEQHQLMGGKLHLYKREGSGCWQCSTYMNGRNHRVSTKEESLSHAKDFAEDWYMELRGKSRAGLLKAGKSFREAAAQFLREYEVITMRAQPRARLSLEIHHPNPPPAVLRQNGACRHHGRNRAGLPRSPPLKSPATAGSKA